MSKAVPGIFFKYIYTSLTNHLQPFFFYQINYLVYIVHFVAVIDPNLYLFSKWNSKLAIERITYNNRIYMFCIFNWKMLADKNIQFYFSLIKIHGILWIFYLHGRSTILYCSCCYNYKQTKVTKVNTVRLIISCPSTRYKMIFHLLEHYFKWGFFKKKIIIINNWYVYKTMNNYYKSRNTYISADR